MKLKNIVAAASVAAFLAASPVAAKDKYETLVEKVEEKDDITSGDCLFFFNRDSTQAKVLVYYTRETEYGEFKCIERKDNTYSRKGNKWYLQNSYTAAKFPSIWGALRDMTKVKFGM